MRIGVPVMADRHAAMRTSCPPPSPVRPSSTTILLPGRSSIFAADLMPKFLDFGVGDFTKNPARKLAMAIEIVFLIA
jgi:hypothetical protein